MNRVCYPEDVVTVRILFVLSCITLAIAVPFSTPADVDEIGLYEDAYPPSYESRISIGFNWIVGLYDFDRIEEYVDEYYVVRYKNWEKYLVGKQREFVGRFGLSDVFFRPDFRRYDNTKVALTKRVWSNRLIFRYLAPVGDVRDFELSVALRPHRFVTFIVESNIADIIEEGDVAAETRLVLVLSGPLGHDRNKEHARRRVKRLLGQLRRFAR